VWNAHNTVLGSKRLAVCATVSGHVQVVNIICHKGHRHCKWMVHCYSTGDGNVYSHEGTLAPPGEYDWTCASFGPLVSTTQTANGSVQPFCTAYGRKCLYFTMVTPIHQSCPFPWVIWTCYITHDALGPCKPTTQTAPRSVQLCLHRWLQSVPILVCLFPPHNCSFPCWHLDLM